MKIALRRKLLTLASLLPLSWSHSYLRTVMPSLRRYLRSAFGVGGIIVLSMTKPKSGLVVNGCGRCVAPCRLEWAANS
jgi:hypothetical protein